MAQAVKTDGANIVMMSDIELSQPVTIQADNGNGVTVTINMNGKKLTFKKAIGQTLPVVSSSYPQEVHLT